MLPETINKDTVKEKPEDGCYVYGMFLEGCRWNYGTHFLDESEPKVLFTAAPTMWLKPSKKVDLRQFNAYACPWYRTADRRGVLATTGHSSNFIGLIPMPINKSPDHWIRRGVCLLMSLVRSVIVFCARPQTPYQHAPLTPPYFVHAHNKLPPTLPTPPPFFYT